MLDNLQFSNLGQINFVILGFGSLVGFLLLVLGLELKARETGPKAPKQPVKPLQNWPLIVVTTTAIYVLAVFGGLAQERSAMHAQSFLIALLVLVGSFLMGLTINAFSFWLVDSIRWRREFIRLALPLQILFMHFSVAAYLSPLMIQRIDPLGVTVTFILVCLLWRRLSRQFHHAVTGRIQDPRARINVSLKVVGLNILAMFGMKSSIYYVSSFGDLSEFYLPLSYKHFTFVVTALGVTFTLYFVNRLYIVMSRKLDDLDKMTSSLTTQISNQRQEIKLSKSIVEAKSRRIEMLEETLAKEGDSHIAMDSLVSAVLTIEKGLFEWNLESEILLMSEEWRCLFGLECLNEDGRVEVEGWRRNFLPHDLEVFDEHVQSLLAGEKDSVSLQARYQQAEGGLLKVEFKLAPVRNAYGLTRKLVGMLEDRTAEMLIEMDFRDNLTEEYKLSRLKSEFVNYLSHEIRTPMTVIASASALMDAQLRQPRPDLGRTRGYLDQVEYALAKLRALVDQTLIFMGSESGVAEMYDKAMVNVTMLFSEVLRVESSRRIKSLPDNFKLDILLEDDAHVAVSEVLLGHVFRQFVCFVFDHPQCAKFLQVEQVGSSLILRADYGCVPDWLKLCAQVKNKLGESQEIIPVEDDDLPFALLLSKRVIRNLKGRFIVRASKYGILLTIELPVGLGERCLK